MDVNDILAMFKEKIAIFTIFYKKPIANDMEHGLRG